MLPGVDLQYMDIMRTLLSATLSPLKEWNYTEHLSSLQALVHLIVLHCIALDPIIPSTIPSSHPCTHAPTHPSLTHKLCYTLLALPILRPPSRPHFLPQNSNPSILLLITKTPLPWLQKPRKSPLGAPKTENGKKRNGME